MNTAADTRDRYAREFRRLGPELPGARVAWLQALRNRAFEQFAQAGFPSAKNEAWKYTDVRTLAARAFVPAQGALSMEDIVVPQYELQGPVLVFVDGFYAPTLSDTRHLPGGVTLTGIAQALDCDPGEIEPWLGRYTAIAQDGIGALNTAFMQDGAFLHLRRGVALDAPIQLVFVTSGVPDSGIYTRNVIVLEADSRATVVERYVGTVPAISFTDVVTEVALDADAGLDHYRIEQEAPTAYHLGSTAVHGGRASRYASHSVVLSGRLTRHALACTLAGKGAECTLNGLYVGSGRQHIDRHIRIDHQVPHCISREWYRGVLDEQARGVFSGRVVVHPQAQQGDAAQSNHNLLLSPDAEADSRPQFEIYADDVKCAHGASTGQLDAEAIFYLRSRGFTEAHARQLLVYAFSSDVLARMPLAPVRAALERYLAERWLQQQPVEGLIR